MGALIVSVVIFEKINLHDKSLWLSCMIKELLPFTIHFLQKYGYCMDYTVHVSFIANIIENFVLKLGIG